MIKKIEDNEILEILIVNLISTTFGAKDVK